MKKRIIVVLAIVMVLFGSTVFAYSYWDNLQQTQSQTLTVGEGKTLQVSTVATAPAGKVLVPSGVVLGPNDVTSVVLTYNVKLDNPAASALNLNVDKSNIKIADSTTNAGLVSVDISSASSTVNDSNVLVTVTVTLSEPSTVAVYNAVINAAITFDLTFTAS